MIATMSSPVVWEHGPDTTELRTPSMSDCAIAFVYPIYVVPVQGLRDAMAFAVAAYAHDGALLRWRAVADWTRVQVLNGERIGYLMRFAAGIPCDLPDRAAAEAARRWIHDIQVGEPSTVLDTSKNLARCFDRLLSVAEGRVPHGLQPPPEAE
jgi:hypothetical protein